jgi:hypothetical protein
MFIGPTYKSLEKIVEILLEREGYKIEKSSELTAGHDFLGVTPKGEKFIGEFWFFRTRDVSGFSMAIRTGILRAQLVRAQLGLALLITNASLDEAQIKQFNADGIEVWDYRTLLAKAFKYPGVFILLNKALQESQPLASSTVRRVIVEDRDIRVEASEAEAEAQIFASEFFVSEENYRRLVRELNSISASKANAIKFEKKCEEIIKVIFAGEVFSWSAQKKTKSTMHRYDLIGRIRSQTDFWSTLQKHFNAKYVIFEFKNYSDTISQREIYSTEKYLYVKAMRTLAIIVSPNGADENAMEACRGALKEQGKVILSLTVAQILSMLKIRLEGGDPSDILVEVLDEMLMTIDR